ncbi:MAG: Rab family GTPase [Thermoplasmata archaeon]
MPKEVLLTKKICMLGDPGVGKTSLVARFVLNSYDDKYISTIGTKVSKKDILFNDPQNDRVINVRLMIWDIAGQNSYQFAKVAFLKGSHGALLVADTTRGDTLTNLNGWIEALEKVTGPVPKVFLGNKADLTEMREFGEKEIAEIAKKYNTTGYITSCKTGDNVETAFREIATVFMKEYLEKGELALR